MYPGFLRLTSADAVVNGATPGESSRCHPPQLRSSDLTVCRNDPLSHAQAKRVCTEWIQKDRPDYEVKLRDPVVAEDDRMVTIGGTAVTGEETVDIMCAVDIREGKVLGGFN